MVKGRIQRTIRVVAQDGYGVSRALPAEAGRDHFAVRLCDDGLGPGKSAIKTQPGLSIFSERRVQIAGRGFYAKSPKP